MIGGKGTYYQYSESVLTCFYGVFTAVIAQLGERKTEDLKVSGSIPDCGSRFAASETAPPHVTEKFVVADSVIDDEENRERVAHTEATST